MRGRMRGLMKRPTKMNRGCRGCPMPGNNWGVPVGCRGRRRSPPRVYRAKLSWKRRPGLLHDKRRLLSLLLHHLPLASIHRQVPPCWVSTLGPPYERNRRRVNRASPGRPLPRECQASELSPCPCRCRRQCQSAPRSIPMGEVEVGAPSWEGQG